MALVQMNNFHKRAMAEQGKRVDIMEQKFHFSQTEKAELQQRLDEVLQELQGRGSVVAQQARVHEDALEQLREAKRRAERLGEVRLASVEAGNEEKLASMAAGNQAKLAEIKQDWQRRFDSFKSKSELERIELQDQVREFKKELTLLQTKEVKRKESYDQMAAELKEIQDHKHSQLEEIQSENTRKYTALAKAAAQRHQEGQSKHDDTIRELAAAREQLELRLTDITALRAENRELKALGQPEREEMEQQRQMCEAMGEMLEKLQKDMQRMSEERLGMLERANKAHEARLQAHEDKERLRKRLADLDSSGMHRELEMNRHELIRLKTHNQQLISSESQMRRMKNEAEQNLLSMSMHLVSSVNASSPR